MGGVCWVSVLVRFQYSEYFGPLFKIFLRMISDLFAFFLFFAGILICFAGPASLLLSNYEGFNTFPRTCQTLFASALGDFDLTEYDEPTIRARISQAFMVVYLVVMTLTLLNFVIALLSDTYAFLKEEAKALFFKQIIQGNMLKGNHALYDATAMIPMPFMPVVFVLSPMLRFLRSERFNRACSLWLHVPNALVGTAFFLLAQVLLLPLAYLATVAEKIGEMFTSEEKGLAALDCVLFTAFGLFALIYASAIDLGRFVYGIFVCNVSEKNEDLNL